MRAAVLLVALCFWTNAAQAQRVPGRVVIKLTDLGSASVAADGTLRNPPPALSSPGEGRDWVFRPLVPATLLRKAAGSDLDRWIVLETQDPADAVSRLSGAQGVEVVAIEGRFRLDAAPNDSAWNRQWGTRRVGTERAWLRTRGLEGIRVGIIDTGIDYLHPDLEGSLWINEREDRNGNRRFDPWPATETRLGVTGDFDGVDQDGNGYVDDVIGFDFVDNPALGQIVDADYATPDPDPADDMGHGTAVAGIIGAKRDNGIGIAGIADGCPLVTARAFDGRGVGAEIDVARALIYLVRSGVRVVNMSFGDVVYSRMLRDVVAWAEDAGVVLVASAGNDHSPDPHYPSSYDAVLSVAAVTETGSPASFSNYGSSVDLAAPGVGIVTTDRKGRYGEFNGTSASAPFVSAAAALILSEHPSWTPAEVRGLLRSAAEDLGVAGQDPYTGAGLVRVDRAFDRDAASRVEIIEPTTDWGTRDRQVVIRGSAASPLMTAYQLEFGMGSDPRQWDLIAGPFSTQVIDDTLGIWDVSQLPDSSYTIRLKAFNGAGGFVESRVLIHVDHSPPTWRGVGFIPSYDGADGGVAVGCDTDEPTLVTLAVREQGSSGSWTEVPLEGKGGSVGMVSTIHSGFLGAPWFFPGRTYECVFRAVNAVGLTSQANDNGAPFLVTIPRPIPTTGFQALPLSLPAARLYDKAVDSDGNGVPEFLVSDTQIRAMEWTGSRFERKNVGSALTTIPRGFGTIAGTGPFLLSSFVRKGYLHQASSPTAFPDRLVWADTTSPMFWPAGLVDVNNDGVEEILAVVNDTTLGIHIWSNGILTRIGSIVNPTKAPRGGRNALSAPRVAVGDFNKNDRTDLLIGDEDGDVFIMESTGGGGFRLIWGSENDFLDAGSFVTTGDFDGDGADEFAFAVRTGDDDIIPFWYVGVYQLTTQNVLQTLWTGQFHGVDDGTSYGLFTRAQNSLSAGEVDGRKGDELILALFPEVTVLTWDPTALTMAPIWMLPMANTNTVVVSDINGDGIPDFSLSVGDSIRVFQRETSLAGPVPVGRVDIRYESADQVRVTWPAVAGATRYAVYEGPHADSLTLTGTVETPGITWPGLVSGSSLLFGIRAVDSSRTPPQSAMTRSRLLRPHDTPRLESVQARNRSQVLVSTSQTMPEEIPPSSLRNAGGTAPESIVRLAPRLLLLTFPPMVPGRNGLRQIDLRDEEGIPFVEADLMPFDVPADTAWAFLISSATWKGEGRIDLRFSAPVDPHTATETSRYRFIPEGDIVHAEVDPNDARVVRIQIRTVAAVGAYGREYRIEAQGVRSALGDPLPEGPGSTAAVVIVQENLDAVFTFPNPLRPEDGQDFITFANLTPKAVVRLYTVSGRFVRELVETDGNGGMAWDLRDVDGGQVPNGVYIYSITGTNAAGQDVDSRTGKLALIR